MIDRRSVLSLGHGVESVLSLGGERESVSLVLATGQTGTRIVQISPSKSFDRLPTNFNQSQLIITLSTLTLALLITNRLVSAQL